MSRQQPQQLNLQQRQAAVPANAPNNHPQIYAQSSGCPQISPIPPPSNSMAFFAGQPQAAYYAPQQPFAYPPQPQALQPAQFHQFVSPQILGQVHPADANHPPVFFQIQHQQGMIQTNGGVPQPITQTFAMPPVHIAQPNIVTTMPMPTTLHQPQQNIQRPPSTLYRPLPQMVATPFQMSQPPKPKKLLSLKKPEEEGGGDIIIEKPKPKDEMANLAAEVNEAKEEKIKMFHDTIAGGIKSNSPAVVQLPTPPPIIESSLPADNSSSVVDADEEPAQPTNDENTEMTTNCGDEQKSQTPDSGMLSDEELHKEILEFKVTDNGMHNPEQRIYHSEFLLLLRRLKIGQCPLSEAELKDYGLSREGMPVSPSEKKINPPRDDQQASQTQNAPTNQRQQGKFASDSFKPNWQQQSSSIYQNRPPRPHYVGRNSGGDNRGGKYRKPYGGRSSYGHQQYRPTRGGGQFPSNSNAQITSQPSNSQEENSAVAVKSSDSEIAQQGKQEELPRKAANAWKPKRSAPPKDEEEQKYDNLKKEIRGLLNKITPQTFDDLTKEFCDHEIYKDPKLLDIIIDLLFDKAVEEPHFCPIYSDLCKKQVTEEREKGSNKFKNAILLKCQNSFLASKEYDEKMEELEMKLNELDKSDEKGKEKIKEEQEMRRFKEKRRVLGYMKFVGQLYRHLLLIERIIEWCIKELIKRYNTTRDEDYLEYTVGLIQTVGKTYEEQLEKNAVLEALYQQKLTMAQRLQLPPAVDKDRVKNIIAALVEIKSSASYRIRFAIMDLEELQRRNWIKRGGEKGPKTIDQVRQEAEEEQRRNESERIEHQIEKQRERNTKQLLRGSGGHGGGYSGRNSSDRRPQFHQQRPPHPPYQGRGSTERQQQSEFQPKQILQRDRSQPATQAQSRIRGNLQALDDLPPTNKQKYISKPQQQNSLGMKEGEEGVAGPSTNSAANEDDKLRKKDDVNNNTPSAAAGKDESK